MIFEQRLPHRYRLSHVSLGRFCLIFCQSFSCNQK
nr:MAG TPA: hypothetical protein [Bacteriophage sp.]